MWYVYILLCDQETFYTGITNDPENRLREHRNKKSFFTKKFSELKVIYQEKYNTKSNAEGFTLSNAEGNPSPAAKSTALYEYFF